MPTTKTKPPKINTTEPNPQQAPAPGPAAKQSRRTSLSMQFLQFDHEEDGESRQLLSDIFTTSRKTGCPFPVVAADEALDLLGVCIGTDRLENSKFIELLKLFCRAVTGNGYGGFHEQIITQFLMGNPDMNLEDALAIVSIEFEQKNSDLGCARQALEEYPEELAEAIQKAAARLRKRNEVEAVS
jgi:hypothetical protein